jgi:mannosyl-oligosaccharide alpha-1,2-mannosidase
MLPPFLEELCIRILAFWNNMRYRRLSIRPLTFIATTIFILLAVYYVILPRDPFSFRILGFSITAGPTTKAEWAERADIVKKSFLHAYHGYEKYALPHDELTPLTNNSSDK